MNRTGVVALLVAVGVGLVLSGVFSGQTAEPAAQGIDDDKPIGLKRAYRL